MPGSRQPTDLILANGRKHLSRAEETERRRREPRVAPVQQVTPPRWLAKRHYDEFKEIGQILLDSGLYTALDRDVLGQYFAAREGWLKANRKAMAAIRADNEKLAQNWTTVQNTYFRQARQCADSMGLTVTSRCRLVLPAAAAEQETIENGFDEFSRKLRARQSAALAEAE